MRRASNTEESKSQPQLSMHLQTASGNETAANPLSVLLASSIFLICSALLALHHLYFLLPPSPVKP